MTRSTQAGEVLVGRAVLRQLVGEFLAMAPEEQRGVAIRVAGPDWTREFVDEEIRELAARPEYGGAFDHWRSDAGSGTHGEVEQRDAAATESVSGTTKV